MIFLKPTNATQVRRLAILLPLLLATGCTVHPEGEAQERNLASQELKAFATSVPPLPSDPTPDDLVHYASMANPELEQRFWEWRSAIEQIPQDGTQATNLVLYAGVPVTNGGAAFNRTVITAANDPMADIQWPSKPTTAAQRALEEARAAGLRFQQAKLDLRQKVLDAYYDYALAAELLRLEHVNTQLLSTTAAIAEAGIASGKSTQSATLTARNEVELSQNRISEMQSRLAGLRAALNDALGRDPAASLSIPKSLPALRATRCDPDQLLEMIASNSPQLASLEAEERAKERGIKLAKLQYVPDFSLSASTDLGGVAQDLMGMITLPVLRYEAINAAIAQAEANSSASDAMRRQASNDLRSKLISDISTVIDLQRQVSLLDDNLIPRADSIVRISQSEYEAGRISLVDLLESERSVNALRQMNANFTIAHEERLLDLENVIGKRIE